MKKETKIQETVFGEVDKSKALEQKLAVLMMNSEESFIFVDINYNIVGFNRQFNHQYIKYFGTEIKKGTSFLNLILPERIEIVKDIFRKVFAGAVQKTEVEIPIPNLPSLSIKSIYKPAFDEHGKIIGAFVSSEDVSKYKRIELEKNKALEKIEFDNNNFRALIDNSSDLIWSFDEQFRLITSNKAFDKHIFELTGNKTIIGGNILLFFNDVKCRDQFTEHSLKALKGENVSIVDHIWKLDEAWREVKFNPIRDSKRVSGVACIARDISKSILNEKKLLEAKIRLKQAQEIAHTGNWQIDFKNGRTILSEIVCELLNINPEEYNNTNKEWLAKVHPDDRKLTEAALMKGIQSKHNFQLRFRVLKTDGDCRYIFSDNIFEKNLDTDEIGFYGIMQDESSRVIKELELKKHVEQIRKQNEWLNNFNQIVSHNMISNKNNIRGLLENLRLADSEDERQEILEMLETTTIKLDETVSNLSSFVRIQYLSENHYKKMPLRKEIDKTCAAINKILVESGTEIVNLVDPRLTVNVVPAFLESIILNLMTNGIKYKNKNKKLEMTITAEKQNNYKVVSFSDNGSGIDLNKHGEAVFGLFKTFHKNKEAVGIGLFMTKNQMELMNGKIELTSEPGIGSTFKLYFNEKT